MIFTILTFLVVFILFELLFRFNFLYKLPEADNWKPTKKDNIVVSMAKGYSSTRLIILIILLLLITILMPIYANMMNMDNFNKYASYIVSLITAIATIITILALIKQKDINN